MNTQDQNLLKETPAERIARPAGFYQEIVLDALTVISATFLGFGLAAYLEDRWSLWSLVAALAPFTTCAVLGNIIRTGLGRRLLIVMIAVLAFSIPFWNWPDANLPWVIGVAAVTFAWGALASRQEAESGLRLRFFRAARLQIGKIVTGLTVVAILLYLPRYSALPAPISDNTFRQFFAWTTDIASNFYQEIRFNTDVGTLLKDLARYSLELQENLSYRNLPPDIQKEFLDKATDQLLEKSRTATQLNIKPEDSVESVAYRLASGAVGKWRQMFGGWFLVFWAAGVFLVMRGVGVFATWLLILAAFFIYQALLGMNILGLTGEGATREVVKWS
ncbi:MAG: hypothetical protein HY978_04805 [Candidatus Liptonbacteria bacterium]|nr:hypothetical protein [Candidatus Liptonbacteria bacterium]